MRSKNITFTNLFWVNAQQKTSKPALPLRAGATRGHASDFDISAAAASICRELLFYRREYMLELEFFAPRAVGRI
eukprot:5020177-Amphidinium_carterae.1